MFSKLVTSLIRLPVVPRVVTSRGLFWSRDPFADMRAMIREMEHQAENMERLIANAATTKLPAFLGATKRLPLIKADKHRPGQDQFNLALDLSDYRPENIKVSLKNRTLVVEAKEEIEHPDGYHSVREMCHQYRIPEDVDLENLVSTLEHDGVLKIEAPRQVAEPKRIPISKHGGGGGGQQDSSAQAQTAAGGDNKRFQQPELSDSKQAA